MSTKHYIAWKRYEYSHAIGEYKDENVRMPPQFVLDRIADEKFSGGFSLKKKNLCEKCFTYRSKNGECNCS